MYYLFRINERERNGTVIEHPLNAVFRSDKLEDVFAEINKKVLDGCPRNRLMVFEEIAFDVEVFVGKKED